MAPPRFLSHNSLCLLHSSSLFLPFLPLLCWGLFYCPSFPSLLFTLLRLLFFFQVLGWFLWNSGYFSTCWLVVHSFSPLSPHLLPRHSPVQPLSRTPTSLQEQFKSKSNKKKRKKRTNRYYPIYPAIRYCYIRPTAFRGFVLLEYRNTCQRTFHASISHSGCHHSLCSRLRSWSSILWPILQLQLSSATGFLRLDFASPR